MGEEEVSSYSGQGKGMDSLSERRCKGASERLVNFLTVQFSSVAQSCPTLCDPMDCSTPGFPVHPQLPELAQTHAIELVIAMFMLKYFSGKDEERGQDIGI